MAFEKAITVLPIAIGDISVVLTDYIEDGEQPVRQEAHFEVQVHYSNGEEDEIDEIKVLTGDLVPHLTPGQVNSLKAFMNDMRTKAEQEILP